MSWRGELSQIKRELWKGIPMSKESEKTYKRLVRMSESSSIIYTPRGGSRMDQRLGETGPSLRDFKRELQECAERDRKAGGKCGLICQMRKRK